MGEEMESKTEGKKTMSLPLITHSKMFYHDSHGEPICAFYKSYDSVANQDEYLRDMVKHKITDAVLNICNEELGTPFSGEFMRSSYDENKLKRLGDFVGRLKNVGIRSTAAIFDCPPLGNNCKYPYWKHSDRLVPFLQQAVTPLAQIFDAFVFAIESNEGIPIDIVEYAIDIITPLAYRMIGDYRLQIPVGTHEQNVGRNKKGKLYLKRRVPRNAHFHGYETMNHPYKGYEVPAARMIEEVRFLANHSGGIPIWVMESNNIANQLAKDQNNGMAAIPGVIGVDGVMGK